METTQINSTLCGGESREYVDVSIDEDLVARLYAQTERVHSGSTLLRPTEQQKRILLDLWPRCRKTDVARALGVSEGVARRWYREYGPHS
jgi:hypothetical protein